MKAVNVIWRVLFFAFLLVKAGCESVPVATELPAGAGNDADADVSIYTCYAPVKIDILPLTEFVRVDNAEEGPKIKVYVSLLDSFGCQIKWPAVFRFELYERVLRSSEPKGRRAVIWPDVDLTEQGANNTYWQDFLRAYKFDLDFEPQSNRSYILQVTCLYTSGRRLSAEFGL